LSIAGPLRPKTLDPKPETRNPKPEEPVSA
jgi:hypothetical protein